MKKIYYVFGGIVLSAFLLWLGIELYLGDQIRAAQSIEKLTDNFYYMEYKGDYKLKEFITSGGVSTDEQLMGFICDELYCGLYEVEYESRRYGCSTLSVKNEANEVLFGRNFDYPDCKAMIVKTKPKDGYASISTCDLEFLNIDDEWNEEEFLNRAMAVAAVYAPVDGMNEKGVCIAVLTVSDSKKTNQESDKLDVTTSMGVRLVLDYAATTEEAIKILENVDMHSSINTQFKFAITDAKGKSVAVEYIDNEMYVVDVQATSNIYQSTAKVKKDERFDVLNEAYKADNGIMDANKLMKTMEKASQKYFHHNHTQWTAVFYTKEKKVDYCHHENFNKKYEIYLK
ncbi:MAG: linear amide C-N hydrolase [Lachnospira sp.]|nr:linear amide C-N hydrolase [Lachnospira sp.]